MTLKKSFFARKSTPICYNTIVDNNQNNPEPVFSDDDVVRSVCEGKVQDFEILINRYKHKIINFIHKMIFDYDEAQSLTQDVFLKIYEGLTKYRPQDTFQAFVFTIAKNLTLNYIKKQRRFSWFSSFGNSNSNDDREENYFQTADTQHQDLEKSQQDQLLTAGLKSLKENQRIALILKVYLDLPYKKIAQITGWSEPKIETLISRAKSDLRSYIISQENSQFQKKEKTTTGFKEKLQETEWSEVL